MELILEEFNQLQIEESQSKAAENVMLAKRGKGKGKKKKGSTQSGNIVNLDIDCWNCGEKGHIHTQCPKTSKKKQTWSKGKGQEAHVTQAQKDYAFSSSIVGMALAGTLDEGTLSQITIYDSGVSMHMSPSRERFSEFRTIAPKGVKVADKTIFMVTSIVLLIQNYIVFSLVFSLFSPRFYNHSFHYYRIWKGTFYIWFRGRTRARFVTRGNHM